VQQAAGSSLNAAKKLEDATKKVEETARVAAAHWTAQEEAQASLIGPTAAAALSVPSMLLCAYVSAYRRPPASETGV